MLPVGSLVGGAGEMDRVLLDQYAACWSLVGGAGEMDRVLLDQYAACWSLVGGAGGRGWWDGQSQGPDNLPEEGSVTGTFCAVSTQTSQVSG